MNDDKLEDLEGLDGSEPINPEQKLSQSSAYVVVMK